MNEKYANRFWNYVDKSTPTECWLWKASTRGGYGQFWCGKNVFAHRLSFYLANGYWPETVDHLCRNKLCVNPAHLEGVSVRENVQRYMRTEYPIVLKPRKQYRRGLKLSIDEPETIRSLFEQGMTQREIAQKFGIHQTTVSKIVLRRRWRP